MTLLRLIIKEYRFVLVGLIFISLASAISGITVIAYINSTLILAKGDPWVLLLQFAGLLLLLLVLRFIAQYSLTLVGHKFVYEFRNNLIKRFMDTDIAVIEKIGSARIVASLSKDIDKVQSAFINAPSFIQSSILSLGAFIYLGYLAIDLLAVVLLLITSIAIIGSFLVKQVHRHFSIVRNAEDDLYKDFEDIIYGRKELSLNRHRAKLLYQQDYLAHADTIRHHIVRGDTFHLTALNWADVMILASTGIVFFLANSLHWTDVNTATTFAITILFLKSPLIQTVGMIPSFLNAQVSFKKIIDLNLHEPSNISINNHKADFSIESSDKDWQKIELKNVYYQYVDKKGVPSFSIGSIDLTLNRGEVVFLIGGNGSGKSTFAKIITGLYRPLSGELLIDGVLIDDTASSKYRQQYSAIYTDLYLFKNIIGIQDSLSSADKDLMQEWLVLLEMQDKLKINEKGQVLNQDLSQGQKKRLAMLLLVMEQRDLVLLDEWAADQDPQFRRIFYFDIIPRLKAMGKTLIVISHDDHYFEQADRLLQMKDGRLLELTGQDRLNASRDAVATVNS